jgi:NodT family efflux transporter outer membrane factor (OMF) lipoprotein
VRRPTILSVALLASGCVSGPQYRIPERAVAATAAANRPFIGADGPGVAKTRLPDRWWRLYQDPRLDGYIEQALLANADLRAADANLRRAQAAVGEADAARMVQTGLSGQGLGSRLSGFTGDTPATYTYSLGLDIGYALDLAGGIRRGIEAAGAQSEAAEAARDQVRVVIAGAVTKSYLQICGANMTAGVIRRTIALQQQTLTAAQRLDQGGRGTKFDVDRARTAAYRSGAALPQLIARRQAAYFELAALLGRTPDEGPSEAEACEVIPTLSKPIPVGDGTALIRRRPDIRMMERTLAARTALIGVEIASLYPRVQLGGSVGTGGASTSLLGSSSFGFGLGPLISWTFPNRKAAHARIAEASASTEAAYAQFDGSVLIALKQTETALSTYSNGLRRLDELSNARDSAATSSEDARRLHLYGRTSFLDLLNAQSAYAQSESDLAQARTDVADQQVDLFVALGGGWQ